jgi:diguanylate cyclase (GGDEF)-like protein
MKILIAETHSDSRQRLIDLLESQGYQVVAAENGLHALDLIRQSAPDLIISDLSMPIMDGFTLCRSIQGIPELNSIPFLVYAHTDTQGIDKELALKLGARRFLRKPQTSDILLEVIDELLTESDSPAARSVAMDSNTCRLPATPPNGRWSRKLERARFDTDHDRKFLQTVIDGVGDPILVIAKDNKVILTNKSAKAFSAEVMPSNQNIMCYQLMNDRTSICGISNPTCPMQKVIETGQAVRVVHRQQDKHRRIRTLEILATPLWDEHGEVAGIIESIRDVSERVSIQNQLIQERQSLEHLSQHDTLTELPNRLLFLDRLERALQLAHHDTSRLALLVIDIDHFKVINDSLGHTLGDKLLVALARRLEKNIREGDTVARPGGDEFTVILGQLINARLAGNLAQTLIDCLRNPLSIDGQELAITASIGISIYPDDGTNAESLLQHADAALYRAKSVGRNTFQFYTQDMTTQAFERVRMESALRRALLNNQFIIHYQPQIDLTSGQVIGAEALIRWQHPEQGMLPPNRFIPIAEESGQISEIGSWVLEFVCERLSKWLEAGHLLIPISINISGQQLINSSLMASMKKILQQSSCQTYQIELEITENFLMHNPDRSINELQQLRDLGINIAIDDFGTGYSSLSNLKRFPLTKLKIDQSFIRDISVDPNDQAITRAIIALGKTLGLSIIAEGVEDENQRNFLREEGCDAAQGFYYSPPLSERQFLEFVESHAGATAD